MSFSASRLRSCLPETGSGIWWIALSGGLDSCVLLDALAHLNLPIQLRALHINHQLSPNADAWELHCATLCKHLAIPFTAVKVTVANTGRGLEDAARAARYAVFEDHLGPGDLLLTAHHADDQTETLLLRLMRGAGPRGLAAMARQRPLGQGSLYRPLLNFTRTELEAYAQARGLAWVDDESNTNDHYDRNYLRNQVMPVLRDRWPGFASKWQQTAELCAANELLIDELAASDLAAVELQSELIGTSISLSSFAGLSLVRRQNLLRHWLRGQGLDVPEQQHLIQIEQQFLAAREDSEAQVNWGNVSLRAYRQRLFALPVKDLPLAPVTVAIPIKPQETLVLPTGGSLSFYLYDGEGQGLRADLPNLNLRFRQGGERCKPAGRNHSQTLKHLLQDYGVAPWLRESLPLIYAGEALVAVADLWICEGYQVKAGEAIGYRLDYRPRCR